MYDQFRQSIICIIFYVEELNALEERMPFTIYSTYYSSSSIKTGRGRIFLCRATCVEQSASWPSEHTWHLNFQETFKDIFI